MSRKRHVLTCRGGESERLDGVPAGHRRERLRVKAKRPPAVLAGGLENPAATYSPGSEDQVPSAMWGLTSVFGMGTGMTPTRLPLKQILHGNLDSLSNRRVTKLREFGLPTRDSRTKSLKERKSVSRAISTARLNVSPRLHLRPIDVVVSDGPSGGCPRET